MKGNKYKSITKLNNGSRGYYVRVFFKKKIHKPMYFGVKTYGGWKKALDAAIKYRNKIEKEIGKVRTNHQVASINWSGTGCLGVRKAKRVGPPVFEATLFVNKKRYYKAFPASKYGEKKAFQMAVKKRKEFEKKYL